VTRRVNRILIDTGIIASLVALGAIGVSYEWLDYKMNRPDLRSNPISGQIMQAHKPWGMRTAMIPEPFRLSTPRTEIEQQLAEAGFVRAEDAFTQSAFRTDMDQGRQIYRREANNLVCNIGLYVVGGFDGTGGLSFAEGAEYEQGCL
jgi:hypothetical protein